VSFFLKQLGCKVPHKLSKQSTATSTPDRLLAGGPAVAKIRGMKPMFLIFMFVILLIGLHEYKTEGCSMMSVTRILNQLFVYLVGDPKYQTIALLMITVDRCVKQCLF
jgi:hypothetical protein